MSKTEEPLTIKLLSGKELVIDKTEQGSGLEKFDVAVFAASCDEQKVNADFAKALKLDYPILCDPEKKAAKEFGVLGEDQKFNRWTFYIGKDGKILHIDTKVDTKNHGQQIAKKLDELKVDKRK